MGEARPRAPALASCPAGLSGRAPGHGRRGCYRGGPKSCRVPRPPPRAPGSTCCGSPAGRLLSRAPGWASPLPPQTPGQPSPRAQLSKRLQKMPGEKMKSGRREVGRGRLSVMTLCRPSQVRCTAAPTLGAWDSPAVPVSGSDSGRSYRLVSQCPRRDRARGLGPRTSARSQLRAGAERRTALHLGAKTQRAKLPSSQTVAPSPGSG